MQFDPKVNPQAEEILRGVHEFKEALIKSNRAFCKDEFLKGMKEIGLPSNVHFWTALRNCKCTELGSTILTKIGQDKYVFTNPKKPIYWKDLQEVYNMYSALLKKYHNNKKEKAQKTTPAVPDEISEAIKLLKSHGYQILAPVAVIYAKM